MLSITAKLEKGKNLILEHIEEGVIVVDNDGVIMYANPAAETQLKYDSGGIRWNTRYEHN